MEEVCVGGWGPPGRGPGELNGAFTAPCESHGTHRKPIDLWTGGRVPQHRQITSVTEQRPEEEGRGLGSLVPAGGRTTPR